MAGYRYRAPYFIVDRLFGAAELRLGGEKAGCMGLGRDATALIPHMLAAFIARDRGFKAMQAKPASSKTV
jgi:hypothetical protein